MELLADVCIRGGAQIPLPLCQDMGSNPFSSTKFWDVSIVGLMRYPVTVEIMGSNPIRPAATVSKR